jgi:hypothetical protein
VLVSVQRLALLMLMHQGGPLHQLLHRPAALFE